MKLRHTAFTNTRIAFAGHCSNYSPAQAALLVRACGGIVHNETQGDTDVVFNGVFYRDASTMQNLETARLLQKAGAGVTILDGKWLRPLLEGELALDDLRHNALLPASAGPGSFKAQL